MSLEYIRWRYGVPAKRGALVKFQGRVCKILGGKEGRLYVRDLTTGERLPIHPTWEVEYELPES